MTNVNWREVGVGSATLAVVAVIGAFVAFQPSQTEGETDAGFRIEADFGRIDGLTVGSPVRLAGLDIGSVERVDLVAGNRAAIVMAMTGSDIAIPLDSAAVIETDGVFGQKYVEIHPGGDFEMLTDGQRLSYSQDSVVLESLLNQIVSRAKAAQEASEASPEIGPEAGEVNP